MKSIINCVHVHERTLSIIGFAMYFMGKTREELDKMKKDEIEFMEYKYSRFMSGEDKYF